MTVSMTLNFPFLRFSLYFSNTHVEGPSKIVNISKVVWRARPGNECVCVVGGGGVASRVRLLKC